MLCIPLPTPADLSVSAVRWAAEILGETPRMLWVTAEEDAFAQTHFGDLAIGVDETIERGAWWLEGTTRAVYSEGA